MVSKCEVHFKKFVCEALTEAVLESIKRALQGLSQLNAAAIQEGKHALGHARDAQRQMCPSCTSLLLTRCTKCC